MFLSYLTKIRIETEKFYKDKTMKRNIGRVVPVIPTHSKDYGQDNRSMSFLEQKALMRKWRIAAAKGNLLAESFYNVNYGSSIITSKVRQTISVIKT